MDHVTARRRADDLDERAGEAAAAALGLDELAGRVDGALDPVVGGLGPPTWMGAAADRARVAAHTAVADLAEAAHELSRVAAEARAVADHAAADARLLRRAAASRAEPTP